jgi:hypothetical protein
MRLLFSTRVWPLDHQGFHKLRLASVQTLARIEAVKKVHQFPHLQPGLLFNEASDAVMLIENKQNPTMGHRWPTFSV